MKLRFVKHIILWIILLLVLNNSDWTWQGFSTDNGTFLIPSLYGTIFNAFIFYFNVFFLFPRFWRNYRKKYILFTVLVLVVASLLEGGFDLWYSIYSGSFENFKTSLDITQDAAPGVYKILSYASFSLVCFIVHLLFLALSFGYLLPKENLRNIALQNAQLKSELKYLKAQIDPHTLFNGINGIYHLIDEDQELAKQYLHGFANILRYQIYDCEDDFILLEKELQFLDRFMQLSSFRRKDDVKIRWDFINYSGSLKVAPQVFLPFVENAFKYVSVYNDSTKNEINANIHLEENKVMFTIMNTYDPSEVYELSGGGVGIENSKSRLELLYPEKYSLEITDREHQFWVQLIIEL